MSRNPKRDNAKAAENEVQPPPGEVLETLHECVKEAGDVLLKFFGRINNPRLKENLSSVVCDADLASERLVVRILRSRYPKDAIIAEESGFIAGTSGRTWVLDPLDGTSNYVAGLPWFGAQMGIVENGKVTAAAIYVPVERHLYHAALGSGAKRDGVRLAPPKISALAQSLCAFGFDAGVAKPERQRRIELLMKVAEGVRNIRTTNSLMDFCFLVQGKFGGCVNLCTKVWDIVPAMLILPEGGVNITDLSGRAITPDLSKKNFGKSYAIACAPCAVHADLIRLTSAYCK